MYHKRHGETYKTRARLRTRRVCMFRTHARDSGCLPRARVLLLLTLDRPKNHLLPAARSLAFRYTIPCDIHAHTKQQRRDEMEEMRGKKKHAHTTLISQSSAPPTTTIQQENPPKQTHRHPLFTQNAGYTISAACPRDSASAAISHSTECVRRIHALA